MHDSYNSKDYIISNLTNLLPNHLSLQLTRLSISTPMSEKTGYEKKHLKKYGGFRTA